MDRKRLDNLLNQIVQKPENRLKIEAKIEDEFSRHAIFILDMSGFSRTTHIHGIVTFLLMIHQMKLLATPIIERFGGTLLKAEADNLFCVFETVDNAVEAARGIMQSLDTVNFILPSDRRLYASVGIGFGDILVLHNDLYGDEVNLACKLGEDIAERGMILLTEEALKGWDSEEIVSYETVTISGIILPYYKLGPA